MQESVDGDEDVVGFAKLQDGKLGLEQVGRTQVARVDGWVELC